jgi:hypothetical protein
MLKYVIYLLVTWERAVYANLTIVAVAAKNSLTNAQLSSVNPSLNYNTLGASGMSPTTSEPDHP